MPKRIAIVEDESELASLIEYNLTRHGYEAAVLSGSKGTLKSLEDSKPNLILLDVMLPDIDGFELCRQIRQSEALARTPVLFLTARSDEVDPRSEKLSGVWTAAESASCRPCAASAGSTASCCRTAWSPRS